MARSIAAAQLKGAKPGQVLTVGNRHSAIGNSVPSCPVCRKPFSDDKELGPIPACECGTRGKVDQEPGQDPADETEDESRFPVRLVRLHCPFPLNLEMDTDDDS
jgi:hypothetical protein